MQKEFPLAAWGQIEREGVSVHDLFVKYSFIEYC